MLDISPNSFLAKIIQITLAVGYVILVSKLITIQARLFGGAQSWTMHFLNVLLVTLVGLLLLFLINHVLLRHAFLRLGIFTSLGVLFYFYIYTLQGQFPQFFQGLLHSPQYLLNMLLFVLSPLAAGKLLQIRFPAH